MKQQKCPICEGSGKLEVPASVPHTRTELDLPKIARTLKKEGYSIREIMNIMGYAHPGSVSHLLSLN